MCAKRRVTYLTTAFFFLFLLLFVFIILCWSQKITENEKHLATPYLHVCIFMCNMQSFFKLLSIHYLSSSNKKKYNRHDGERGRKVSASTYQNVLQGEHFRHQIKWNITLHQQFVELLLFKPWDFFSLLNLCGFGNKS